MEDFFVIAAGVLLAICAGVKLLVIATYKKNSAICIAVSSRWSHSGGTSSFGYSGTFQYEYDGTEIIANDKSFLDATKLEVGLAFVFLSPIVF